MNPDTPSNTPRREEGAHAQALGRRDLLKMSALATVAAAGGAVLPGDTQAAPEKSADAEPPRKKTFLAVEGHLDDAEIGAGGVLIQAARAGHRVVIVTVASDYSSWLPTVGREQKTKDAAVELAKSFGFEKRFIDGKYHQTNSSDLEFKRKLADIYVELKPDVAFICHYEDHWPDHRESGLAAKDAFLFSHGLSHDLHQMRVPLILGYGVSPIQTYHFEPDVYYDVTNVMPAYMDLIARVEAVRTGRPVEREIMHEFVSLSDAQTLRLSQHGVTQLAETIRWGNRSGCEYAIGFRTVWGQRRGAPLV
jgi:LmbE family N-acetylglucosaminyl deacetylase